MAGFKWGATWLGVKSGMVNIILKSKCTQKSRWAAMFALGREVESVPARFSV